MHGKQLFELKGKTAIVTGGGRGLGAQISEALAEMGANVVLCSRRVEACKDTHDSLRKLGVECLSIPCDVRNPDDAARVVAQTMAHFGRIDILVNNSGASWGEPAEDMSLEAWKKVIDVNVTGTFLMSQAAGRIMIKQNHGKIINIASIAGLVGTDPKFMDAVGYSASKGAVISFTKDLAAKWGQYNIHVNAIAPGFFPTKMSHELLHRGGEHILAQTPLRRYGSENDLKGGILFLASDASNFVTGTTLVIDGGLSIM